MIFRPSKLKVLQEGVHLWTVTIAELNDLFTLLEGTLSSEECQRAYEYRFDRDRRNFILRRGALRSILSSYLDADPGEIRFLYGPYGKPEIKGRPTNENIKFNISHSGDFILYAVSIDREIGADIEQIRSINGRERIVSRFFTVSEQEALDAFDEKEQLTAFYKWWTQKEAIIKALGTGLSCDITKFSVNINPIEPAAILDTQDDLKDIWGYQLTTLRSIPGYAGAVAVERQARENNSRFGLC